MTKILFVAGMPRSGTTVFQGYLLSKGCVCLGEVGQTIDAIRRKPSKPSVLSPKSIWNKEKYNSLKFNEFWSEITKDIRDAESISDAFDIVYSHAFERYPNSIVVDSSKHIGHLRNALMCKFKSSIDVFLIIRDYRSWLVSIEKYNKKYSLPKVRLNKIRWVYVNSKLESFIKNKKINKAIIYYEQMIILNEFEFFDNYLSKIVYSDYEDKFFEMFGSRDNLDSIIKRKIFYDNKWILYYKPSIVDFLFNIYLRKVSEKYSESKNDALK